MGLRCLVLFFSKWLASRVFLYWNHLCSIPWLHHAENSSQGNSDCKYVLKPLGFEPPIPFSGSSQLCPNTYSLSPSDSRKVRVPGIPAWLWQQLCSNLILVPDRLKHRANKKCLQALCNSGASVCLRTVSWEDGNKSSWLDVMYYLYVSAAQHYSGNEKFLR